MPVLRTYRIFISHAWDYNSDYHRVIRFLEAASNFRFSNYSVPYFNPLISVTSNQLESELLTQVRPVHACVILGGMYVSYRDWIQFEIDLAVHLCKPIVGILPWGQKRMPRAIVDAADEIVGWNGASIVGAIRRNAL